MPDKSFIFGLSLKGSISDLNSIFKAVDVSPFKHLEVSGIFIDWLSESNTRNFNLSNARFEISSISNIIPSNIAGEIAGRGLGIQRDFALSFSDTLELIGKYSITKCSMDINLESSFVKADNIESKVLLLKKITPELIRKKIKMLLPIRIPSILNIDISRYPVFARQVMNPNLEFAVDIHPHEFRVKPDPVSLLKLLRFKLGLVSFVYEPESGNYFVPKLLTPWLEALEELQYSGLVFITPRTTKSDIFASEISKLSHLVEDLNGVYE